jgi:Tol biopolymer transport system component
MIRKTLSSAVLLIFAATFAFAASPRKIAYEHDENIFVANLDGANARKIASGALPDISPDGTRVAFNTEGDAKAHPGPERTALNRRSRNSTSGPRKRSGSAAKRSLSGNRFG